MRIVLKTVRAVRCCECECYATHPGKHVVQASRHASWRAECPELREDADDDIHIHVMRRSVNRSMPFRRIYIRCRHTFCHPSV